MRISEELRAVSLKGLKITGNYTDDIDSFCNLHGGTTDSPDKIGLRIALGEPMTVHQLTEGVCKKILNVRIENLPDNFPQFLKTPFLIESKPDKYLFDDVHTIGGFIKNDGLFVVIAYCEGNSIVLRKENPFTGNRIDEINFDIKEDYENIARKYEDKARNIFPFITVLSLMLEAEKSPVIIDGGSKKSRKKKNSGKKKGQSNWIERRIYIDAKYQSKQHGDHLPMDKEGKIKRDVSVQGFLRNQPYGPKHELRKWIYVEGFERSQWVNQGDKKIIVTIKGN